MDFRKVALATWKEPSSPVSYGELDMPLSETHKGSPLPLIIFNIAQAVKLVPEINVWIRFLKIVPRDSVDVTVMVHDKPGQLQFVTIRNCDQKSVQQITEELSSRVGLARSGNSTDLAKADVWIRWTPRWVMSWLFRIYNFINIDLGISLKFMGLPYRAFGSVIISNVGNFGIKKGFVPMVPLARANMLVCVGQVAEQLSLKDGVVSAKSFVPLGITFDHRLIDGYHAGKMAQAFLRAGLPI